MADDKPKEPTKKTAAAKTKADSTVYAYPLPAGHYFSTPSTLRQSTSSGPYVKAVQKAVGAKQSGEYDSATRDAVMKWQDKNGLPVTGVIGEDDWSELDM